MQTDTPHLFTPLSLGPLALPNRIVIAPMCQYACQNDGQATDWLTIHLGHLALSGAGLLLIEATAVLPEGRITHADLGLWDAATEAALARVLAAVRRHSPMPIGIQLAHAGRKASCARPWDGGAPIPPGQPLGWQTVAPTATPFRDTDPAPRALSEADIAATIQAFADAARRAHRLGLDAIEVHAAHGYLLHQFLSPLSNTRSDAWGGSLEARMRLPLAVFDAVRAAVPAEVAVGVRISATDWVEGGWDVAQSTRLAQALQQRGCDFLDVSSGGISTAQRIDPQPGYQVPLADAIRGALVAEGAHGGEPAMPVIAVGLITEPQQAEAILAARQADAVALARGILYDPRWPWHAAAALGASVQVAPQYLRSEPVGHKGLLQAQ